MSVATFYPYRVAGERLQLDLEPLMPAIDKKADGSLYATAPDLQEVAVRCNVSVPDRILQKVIPPAERRDPPVEVRLLCQSDEARIRRAYKLEGDLTASFRELVFQRAEFRGRIDLEAVLVRTSSLASVIIGFASEKGARLAWSQKRSVYFDPPPPPLGDYIEVRWENFSASTKSWLRAHKGHLFALDWEKGRPVIVLNGDVPHLRQVLESEATAGPKARIRKATNFLIAHQVWTSIIAIVLAELSRPDEQQDDWTVEDRISGLDEWKQNVMRGWSPYIFPDRDKSDALEELVRAAKDTGGWREVMIRLANAIQERFSTYTSFRGLVQDCLAGAAAEGGA